jgi:heptosyltransferase-2
MPKILVIRFSSIGDIVLASPVFRCLKNQLPNAEIHLLTKSSFKMVTINNPYIDRFFYFDNDLDSIVNLLKLEEYDYVIDLHNNIRSNKVKRALKRETFTINKLSLQKFLLTKIKINLMPSAHITQRSLAAVLPLGVKDDGKGLDYFIGDSDRVSLDDIPSSHQLGFVALVIGANHATKKMPIDKLKELCHKINYPIILLGGKDEKQEGDIVASIDPIKIYNSCAKFSLNESADIIHKSKLVVSHDTGLQYIACAFQKPVLAIWGGTSPKLQVEPYYGSSFVNYSGQPIYENIVLNLWCQPCSKYGKRTCPLGHFNCMKKHDINLIVQKIHSRLGLI